MKSSGNFRLTALPRFTPAELHGVYQRLRDRFGHQRWWPADTPFEVMIGAILTQNTAWTNVEKAILNLKRAGRLSFRGINHMTRRQLARLIRPAGYFNIKADRIKHFVRFLGREYGGNFRKMRREPVAVLREKLLRVKGIGPETADSILLYALGKRSFVIDAYTRRIFSRHGLMAGDRDYHEWKDLFEKALPPSRAVYNDFHAQIVYLAKHFCRTVPVCGGCPLQGLHRRKKMQNSFNILPLSRVRYNAGKVIHG
ncbi:MAG TPA: endonuclease III domain-containing protein [Candidatus Omnitrophota bacterium]|jgi:endonuclease-3 related protein|nr:endonuclease III domain-containing protein [Candidatus Omnitrophota bacterium]